MNTMTGTILDGNKIAAQIKAEVAEEVQKLSAAGIRPGLAVILAGHNPASEIYVRNKVKSCQQLGMLSENLTPPDSVTTAELLQMIAPPLAPERRRDLPPADFNGTADMPLPGQLLNFALRVRPPIGREEGNRPAPDFSDVPARGGEISHWGASLYALPRPRHMSILRGPIGRHD